MQLRLLEASDFGRKIVDIEDDAVPTAGRGSASVRHRFRGTAGSKGGAEDELEITAGEHREIRLGLLLDLKAEILGVKRVDREGV